jgi:hypothetical protein
MFEAKCFFFLIEFLSSKVFGWKENKPNQANSDKGELMKGKRQNLAGYIKIQKQNDMGNFLLLQVTVSLLI